MTTSKNTINFLALTLTSIEVPVADRKACPNCGDPDCGSEDRIVQAKLFTEAERDIALALVDGDEDLSSPVPPFNGESSAIGRHFKGGKICVFEIHHKGVPVAAIQSFALDQAMDLFRRVVWQGPRVDGDMDPEALQGVLTYETPAVAVAA